MAIPFLYGAWKVSRDPYFGCDITLHGKVPIMDGMVLSQAVRCATVGEAWIGAVVLKNFLSLYEKRNCHDSNSF